MERDILPAGAHDVRRGVEPQLLTRRNVAAERPAVCRRGSSARRAPTTAGAVTAADAVDPVKKRKVMVFVEPSPFSHVSGMRNRFLGLIESLDQEGDDVRPALPATPSPPAAIPYRPALRGRKNPLVVGARESTPHGG